MTGPEHRADRVFASQVLVEKIDRHKCNDCFLLAITFVRREVVGAKHIQVVPDPGLVAAIKLNAGGHRVDRIGAALNEQHRRRRCGVPRTVQGWPNGPGEHDYCPHQMVPAAARRRHGSDGVATVRVTRDPNPGGCDERCPTVAALIGLAPQAADNESDVARLVDEISLVRFGYVTIGVREINGGYYIASTCPLPQQAMITGIALNKTRCENYQREQASFRHYFAMARNKFGETNRDTKYTHRGSDAGVLTQSDPAIGHAVGSDAADRCRCLDRPLPTSGALRRQGLRPAGSLAVSRATSSARYPVTADTE